MGKRTKANGHVPGRQPKHGARVLERLLRANKLDRRTATARMLRMIADDIAADAGGSQNLTMRERLLVDRCAAAALILQSIEAWIFRQPTLVVDGELLNVLRKGYVAHSAQLTRSLVALGLRPEKAGKLPSLGEYLDEHTKQNGNGTARAPTTSQSDTPAAPTEGA